MPTKEEIARGASTGKKKKAVQGALAGFGVPDKVVVSTGWDEAEPELLVRLIYAITRLGGAIMFGQSRDGGALQVVLYLDGDKKAIWLPGNEDLDANLHEIIQRAEAMN